MFRLGQFLNHANGQIKLACVFLQILLSVFIFKVPNACIIHIKISVFVERILNS